MILENFEIIKQLYDENKYDSDFTRDYATAAFRFYARCGKPSYEELKQAVYESAYEKSKNDLLGIKGGISKPTEQAVINAENALINMEAKLLDILAVERTLEIAEKSKRAAELKKVIDCVYFSDAKYKLSRGDIINRVTYVSLLIPCSDRQVYRLLKEARDIFCAERGLRM